MPSREGSRIIVLLPFVDSAQSSANIGTATIMFCNSEAELICHWLDVMHGSILLPLGFIQVIIKKFQLREGF